MSPDLLMSLTNPETQKADHAIFEEVASGRKNIVRREKQYQRRDGKGAWADLTRFSQRGPPGKTTLITDMAIDISEKKHLEQQLRQSQKMETIGRLAGGVAHDFNNLLTVIRGYSKIMMEDRAADTTLITRLGHIKRAAGRTASLTYQLLAFSRQHILQPRVFRLDELVCESTKMLQRLIGEDIEMRIVGTTNLGKVKADPGQIEQVILNLAVNARDAMPDGGTLTIETSNAELTVEFCEQHAGAEPGRYVMLGVTDTGVGMDKDTMLHFFEPFYTTKEIGKGTGLGLSMVYGIVKQSGGYILVESGVGEGDHFPCVLASSRRGCLTGRG